MDTDTDDVELTLDLEPEPDPDPPVPDTAGDPAAEAFARLEGEMALMRRAVQHLAAERAAGEGGAEDGGVVLLKEQQWRSDFATAVATPRRLRGSVPATGLLRPSADGEAQVTSPIDGHLRPAPGGFPYTGMPVAEGQVMAYLVPQLGGDTDVAGLELSVTRAASARDLARQERERLDALWQQRSVPNREVLQARSAEEVAEAIPGLVARDRNGNIETVMYQYLAPMLLNEYQKQQRTIAAQEERLAAYERDRAAYAARQAALVSEMAELRRSVETLLAEARRNASVAAAR